jgi:hypothetical protein
MLLSAWARFAAILSVKEVAICGQSSLKLIAVLTSPGQTSALKLRCSIRLGEKLHGELLSQRDGRGAI